MTVRIGQTWRDLDKRRTRTFTVLAVDPDFAKVHDCKRTTRIALDRFAPGIGKYDLVQDAPEGAHAVMPQPRYPAPVVEKGQWYECRDRRNRGRRLRVVSIDTLMRIAICEVVETGREVMIALHRFRPTANGYRLIPDVSSATPTAQAQLEQCAAAQAGAA